MSKKKPPKKQLTRAQILSKVKLMRRIMNIMAPRTAGPKNPVGKEKIFDTDAGYVRCLVYNFDRAETLPLIVNIHGSGFTIGHAEMDDEFVAHMFGGKDVKVISIDYSLAPEEMFPVALEQCYAVVAYASEHAEELKIDGNRIILLGHSAGGNFSCGIGLLEKERKRLPIRGIILDFPPTDIDTDPYDKPQPKGALPPAVCRLFDAAYRKPEDSKNPLVSPALQGNFIISIIYNYHIIIQYRANYPILYNIPGFML
jgi:acetyl esterase